MSYIKHFIKKRFQILWQRHKFSPQVQIAQRQLFHFYQLNAHQTDMINLKTAGYSVCSQFEEDGKILFLLAVTGIHNNTFIDIGADDGLNSNCANLALNFGFHGLFIDANKRSIERGNHFYARYPNPYGYKPQFVESKVTRENINELISRNGYSGEIDVLSIDIDGNDFWIWDAIEVVQPRIVVIETHIIYGERDIVAPYDPDYVFPGKHPQYHGASPAAMVNLGRKKGYRLVGANALGFNFIFLRDDLGGSLIPEVSIQDVLTHPNYHKGIKGLDPKVLELKFETPE